MEKTVNNVEEFVKIKRIANVDEDGVINLEMADGRTFGVFFAPDCESVHVFPPKGVVVKRTVFDFDSGVVRGFTIGKAVE